MSGITVVERSAFISADADELRNRIANLPGWIDWSPWEGVDAALSRTYTGEPGAVGSSYSWSGNRKAGAGRMTITAIDEDAVALALEFTKPFASRNTVRFALHGEGDGTRVTWRMESPRTWMSRLFNVEKFVGRDFERGLDQLRRVAEAARG